jgi:hypothetical protein
MLRRVSELVGSCECGSELWGPIKTWNFLTECLLPSQEGPHSMELLSVPYLFEQTVPL